MNQEKIKTKINGTLLGVVVGDLLGEQVEGLANPGILTKFRNGAKYTDDTEMTLITMQHLITFNTIKPVSLTLEYASNATLGTRKYGGNASKTLNKIKQNPELWDCAYTDFLQEGSWGNGCLMRISPIALYDLNATPTELSKHLSDCLRGTHNNEEALQCSIEYCTIIKEMFTNTSGNVDAKTFIDNIISRNNNSRLTEKVNVIKRHIIDSDKIKTFEELYKFMNEGIVEHSIRASDTLALTIGILAHFFKYKQWTATQLLSIMVAMGGDTDTNAAILGSILGALLGVSWIELHWFNNIEDKTNIMAMFQKFLDFVIKHKKV